MKQIWKEIKENWALILLGAASMIIALYIIF